MNMHDTKKNIAVTAAFVLLAFLAGAQQQMHGNPKGDAYYTNPIFAGDYPDPSIMRDGDDYYIVHSSFEYYPGLLIWHSKDLVNWTPVTHALHKYIGSVWAPCLVQYGNKYYIYFPAGNTNYVITANSISGPWSDPVDLKIGFIDPGHFTDAAGKRYLYFSNGAYVPLADDGLSVTGEVKFAYSGWKIPREWSIECFCMEGPKMIKRGDYYYLTVAEGGTAGPATSHMVISARSKSPFGPWENSPYDPIIRTKSNSEQWWSKGHGTLFEGPNGKWWMVFHGYENGYYNMGRQTLLEPVEWTKDGWFKIPEGIKTDGPILKPLKNTSASAFSLNDNFSGHDLKPQWQFFGEYDTTRFHQSDNSLTIKGKGTSVANCAPLLCIPSNHSYTAQVELVIEGNAVGGLVLFYNNSYYSGILADKQNVLANLRGWQFPTEKGVIKNHVFLKIRNIKNTVDMYYSTDGIKWNKIENSVEVSGYNHNVLSGFLSLRLGLCAVGDGAVKFENFIYQPLN
jgi:xylan 1,4-beta-xylosidase